MRDIEFRGRLTDGMAWAFGDLFQSAARDFFVIGGYPVEKETIGQYTGMKDKDGVKIFEGDIVRYCGIYEYEEMEEWDEEAELRPAPYYWEKDVVKWQGKYCPAFDLDNHQYDFNGLGYICDEHHVIEVIGNIHDNPELLKEGEEE
jgi:uncharacterized phage protein (TIGR01671 family)